MAFPSRFEHSRLRLALLVVALVAEGVAVAGLVTNVAKFSERGLADSLPRIVLGLGTGILLLTLAVSVGRALPQIGKTRMHAKEAGALKAISALNRAQIQYPCWYSIWAVPAVFGSSGARTFYSEQSFVIRQNDGPEPATASSAAICDM